MSAILLALIMGCSQRQAAIPPPADAATMLSVELISRLCEGPCPGKDSVVVYRDDKGAIGRLAFRGDLAQCSHVSVLWFDPDGTERHAASDRPAEPAEVAKHQQAIRELLEGLTEAETMDCPH